MIIDADWPLLNPTAAPDAKTYPHVARWYKHIATWESEHANLKGDASASPLLTLAEAEEPKAAQASAAPAAVEEDDDDVDLFGSDDDDEEANAEAERVKNERIAAYKAKKDEKAAANAAAGKDAPVAKSVVTMQVKPWDDETDMAELEKCVRSIEKDGLVWGLSKLVPVGYGVRMLQINLVIEDEKIGLDDLQEGEFDRGFTLCEPSGADCLGSFFLNLQRLPVCLQRP
jgi:elongation factor 1-beta